MTITNLETSKTIKLGYNAKRNKILEDIVVKTPKQTLGWKIGPNNPGEKPYDDRPMGIPNGN